MKKVIRLRENIEIGDSVFVSSDEYQGTVIDVNGDEVLVDGPFGEEYFDINDLEKLGGDYEEDETPNFFKKRFTESKRKNIIRLTESELTNLVKRLISETPIEGSSLPIKKLYVDKTIGGQGSYVILEIDGSEHKVKFLSPECKDGSYSQNEIPNGCVAKIVINTPEGGMYNCSRNGCEENIAHKKEVVVSRPSPYIEFDLKEPIDDFDFIKYDKRTGEILGNGEKGRVVAKTQPNKDEDWVRDWCKRNKIKVF